MTPEERARDIGAGEGAGEGERFLLELVRGEEGENVVEELGREEHRWPRGGGRGRWRLD